MSKKILFISNFLEKTGWGQAARGLAIAMDSVGIDVICRNISMGGPLGNVEPEIETLLSKKSNVVDICVQHVLPQYMIYDGYFKKNIGSFVTETGNLNFIPLYSYINQMDELWVANYDMQRNINTNVPKYIIPHAFDEKKYTKDYGNINIPEIDGDYKFYFIGEANRRKHLSAVLQAFHLEFSPSEPVSLVLKVHKPGFTTEKVVKFVSDLCNTVKTNLKLYSNPSLYKSEVVIGDDLSDEEICKIHQSCDCYVSSSYGEAWSIPTFEAACFGNSVIYTNEGGPADYLKYHENSYPCEFHKTHCFGMIDTIPEFYTGREECSDIDIFSLRKAMRKAYTNKVDRKPNLILSEKYNYTNVGKIIKERLI